MNRRAIKMISGAAGLGWGIIEGAVEFRRQRLERQRLVRDHGEHDRLGWSSNRYDHRNGSRLEVLLRDGNFEIPGPGVKMEFSGLVGDRAGQQVAIRRLQLHRRTRDGAAERGVYSA